MNDNQYQARLTIWNMMKDLSSKNWQGRDAQPWLNPPKSYARPYTTAAKNGKRADQNGSIRNLKLSDMGTILLCERLLGAAYTATTLQHAEKLPLNQSKGGTKFHAEIEKLFPSTIQTEHTKDVSPYVNLPSIGYYTTRAHHGKRDGITGMIDAYIPQYNAGLELKSVPIGWEFPEAPTEKALGQGALYSYGLNNYWNKHGRKPENWFFLYLPQDMRTFNANDKNTFRVFYYTHEELTPIAEDILQRCINVAKIIDEHGFYESWNLLACHGGETCHCSN